MKIIANIGSLTHKSNVMTRFVLLLIVMLSMIMPAFAQRDPQQLYERKIESFTKMRNGGTAMACIGAGLATAGAVMIATLPDGYWSVEEDYYYGDDDDIYGANDDVKAVFGVISIGVGIGLLAGGITMSSIGSHKIKQYKGKINSLSFGIKNQGFTLTYKF